MKESKCDDCGKDNCPEREIEGIKYVICDICLDLRLLRLEGGINEWKTRWNTNIAWHNSYSFNFYWHRNT